MIKIKMTYTLEQELKEDEAEFLKKNLEDELIDKNSKLYKEIKD